MHLDHVALASRDSFAILDVLVGDLGGTVLQGAIQTGFRPVQVRMGDAERGLTIELLEPYGVEEFDFLERFLQARGPGPHHLTFKVADLAAEIDRVRAAGYHPTGILLDNPRWKECFLAPAEAHGTVVQLAQDDSNLYPSFAVHFAEARAGRPYGEPKWWDDPRPARRERPSSSASWWRRRSSTTRPRSTPASWRGRSPPRAPTGATSAGPAAAASGSRPTRRARRGSCDSTAPAPGPAHSHVRRHPLVITARVSRQSDVAVAADEPADRGTR